MPRRRSPAGPAAGGGTPRPTPTRASTARSWVTAASSGGRRGSTRQTRTCWGRSQDVGCSRWAPEPPSAHGGCSPRGRRSSRSTCRTRSWPIPAGSTPRPEPTCRWSRPTPARCRSRRSSFDLACSAYGAVPFVADVLALHARGRPRAPPGRSLGLLGHPPGALGLPGRGRPGRAQGQPVLLRPQPVRRDGRRRRGVVRRAPPHPRRPGPRARGGGFRRGRRRRAGVAARQPRRSGAAGRRCGEG